MRDEKLRYLMRQIIRRRGVTIVRLADRLGISRVTMAKLVKDPLKMSGYVRRHFAAEIGLPVELLDDLVNGNLPTDAKALATLMEIIQPVKGKGDENE